MTNRFLLIAVLAVTSPVVPAHLSVGFAEQQYSLIEPPLSDSSSGSNVGMQRPSRFLSIAPKEATPKSQAELPSNSVIVAPDVEEQASHIGRLVNIPNGPIGHEKLYLEEPLLERYGQSHAGPIQTAKSTFNFFTRAPFVPSKMLLLPVLRRR